eukprot:TRINITY_DN13095_c0_g1_i5.p2 TRINITY_DN13095_c0_g1~~TRINITY_DN13095_c0_g1_i5.p2  ORF type:complete len:159 (+),score=20.45 TRINITY_DN13095_c0_g1_i5:59-535(+)
MDSAQYIRLGKNVEPLLRDAANNAPGWSFVHDQHDVETFVKKSPTSKFKMVKGVAVVGVSAQQLADCINLQDRRNWDDLFIEGRDVQAFNSEVKITYMAYRAPLPGVKNRDFVLLTSHFSLPNSTIVIKAGSVEVPEVPPRKVWPSLCDGVRISSERR